MERLIQIRNMIFKIIFKILSVLFILSDIIALPFWKIIVFCISKDVAEYKKRTNFKVFNRKDTSNESYEDYIGFKFISGVFTFAMTLAVCLAIDFKF